MPDGAAAPHLERWAKLRALTIEECERCLKLADPSAKLDFQNTTCDEWEDRTGRYFGMRHRDTRMKHGIVRHIQPNGKIWEQTFQDDEAHGLQRGIWSGGVSLSLQ